MYSHPQKCEKYCQFIFPRKIDISNKEIGPRFHTFLAKELNGNQSFFHCFTFYEKLTEYQIMGDYDFADLGKKRAQIEDIETTSIFERANIKKNHQRQERFVDP